MGIRAGVADINILLPGPRIAFLELKTAKGRLSLEQRAFRDDVERLGCAYAMARSVDEALATLKGWGAVRGVN